MEVFCGKTINQYKSVFVIQQKQTLPFIFYYLVNKPWILHKTCKKHFY